MRKMYYISSAFLGASNLITLTVSQAAELGVNAVEWNSFVASMA